MPIELEELKENFNDDFTHNQTTRLRAADDLFFARVSQWDTTLLADSQLTYKGEFNICRKATRHIMADLRNNPVQIDFEEKPGCRDGGAEILDGLYLSDDRTNSTMEAYENACQEAVDCGIGGWERYTDYESRRSGERHQVVRARPIYEFNNNAFPDCQAKLADKSDARRWTILEPYSHKGYRELYKRLTGEDPPPQPKGETQENFGSPQQSYVFPWVTNDVHYVGRCFYKDEVPDRIITLSDPLGSVLRLRESDVEDGLEELQAQGYSVTGDRKIMRGRVTCYIASGADILGTYLIAGEWLPIIPIYGERGFVEGTEYWEGVIRLAKDPQRLRNFMLSYLGDTVARGQRKKPIFGAEQIAGLEHMYEMNGADNNYPYLLQKLKDKDGNELPRGPVGYVEAPDVGAAMAAMIQESRTAVEDVANPGLPKEYGDPQTSGKAIELMQARFDQQSIIYQQNLKHGKRYDAQVFASMVVDVYDTPRDVTLTMFDGTRKTESLMQTTIDGSTGNVTVKNDITNMEFSVYADVGPSYSSMRNKLLAELGEMAEDIKESDPTLFKAINYQRLLLMESAGINLDDIRDYVNKQLLLMGFRKPETDEEKQFMAQAAQQQGQPDANMVLAQAESMKGQAALLEQKRELQNDQVDQQVKVQKAGTDQYNAETRRIEATGRIQRDSRDLDLLDAKITGQHISNIRKAHEPFRARVNG